MDPLTLAITSALVTGASQSTAAAYETLRALLKEKIGGGTQDTNDRLEIAKQQYVETVRDRTTPLEKQRGKLLAEVTQLQTSVILTIVNPPLLLRILPLLYAQAVELYEAKTEQELTFVELNLGQIKGTLERYKRMLQQRRWARSLAIVVTLMALLGLGILIFFASRPQGPSSEDVLPIIQVPLPILIYSTIGSFAAILYRFNKSGDIELQDPLRWLFTRPITGVVMGVIAYFVLRVGFLSIDTTATEQLNSSPVMWLIAFIAGFSDRFADSILHTLVGRFGGDTKDELLSLQDANNTFGIAASLNSLSESIPIINRGNKQQSKNREYEANSDSEDTSVTQKNVSTDAGTNAKNERSSVVIPEIPPSENKDTGAP